MQDTQDCSKLLKSKLWSTYQAGLPISIVHKYECTVFHVLFMVHKLPQLAPAVKVPHLQLPIVAACQQAAFLGVQGHSCEAATAVAPLEVTLTGTCVHVPHADGAALVTTDDLQRNCMSTSAAMISCMNVSKDDRSQAGSASLWVE